MRIKTTQKTLTSVGIDVGSSTSHLVFSNLILEKDLQSRTEKFEVSKKEIIFSGPIHMTPFSDSDAIDFQQLKEMLLDDYRTAGIDLNEVDTGAVIITGESAKKENASEIVEMLAGETGKFVAAAAGPNFESILAAYGSGAVARSGNTNQTIMNVDVGGGSSNIAICKSGRVIATSAINVGGRLVAFDRSNRIIRLEKTCTKIADLIGIDMEIGDTINESHIQEISKQLAKGLADAIKGRNDWKITDMLMITDHHGYSGQIDDIIFSGGVAEYIYHREKRSFGDLGPNLALEIGNQMKLMNFQIIEPKYRIRATVIGAGQSSLKVSGSTTFLSANIRYPLRNIPVVVPIIEEDSRPTSSDICDSINQAIRRMDLQEGGDHFILAFNGSVRPSYERLTEFAKGLVSALPKTIRSNKPILLCFSDDIGNSVGNVIRRETSIINPILSIDELTLNEGDYVDVGEPIIENLIVPVIVKTLVFSQEGGK